MKITVRLDDITATMNWKNFRRMEELLDEYHIAPLLGIVPDNRDEKLMTDPPHPRYADKIREWQEKGWTLAMHGMYHRYTTRNGGMFPLNSYGEFGGVAIEKQEEMILAGKKRLKEMGITTEVFMAPAHSYDGATLKALQKGGFRYITDGFGKDPYRYKGMIFLPIAFMRERDIQKKNGYTTLVFHTNTMKEADFTRAGEIFREYEADFIPYSDYLQAEAVKRGLPGRAAEYALARTKRFLVKRKRG